MLALQYSKVSESGLSPIKAEAVKKKRRNKGNNEWTWKKEERKNKAKRENKKQLSSSHLNNEKCSNQRKDTLTHLKNKVTDEKIQGLEKLWICNFDLEIQVKQGPS